MIKASIFPAALSPLVLSGALLLGGCMGTENRGLESVHQPVVARSDYVLDLGTAGGQLASGERRRLQGWMDTLRLGYGDHVAIDDPAGEGRYARDEVAGVVARYGLLLDETAPVTAAPVTPATVRVVVSRMRASVPHCPDWSRDASHEYDSNSSSNFGCATNGTLAAMVANPADLVRGAAGSAASDASTSYKAIDAFRKATPTGNGGTAAAAAGGGK